MVIKSFPSCKQNMSELFLDTDLENKLIFIKPHLFVKAQIEETWKQTVKNITKKANKFYWPFSYELDGILENALVLSVSLPSDQS